MQALVPAVLAVGVLALVVLPYFRSETVVETLPASAAELSPPATGVPAAEAESTATTMFVPAPARISSGAQGDRPPGIGGCRSVSPAALYHLPDGTAFVRFKAIDVKEEPRPRQICFRFDTHP